jgi:ribosomal protein L16/L10AE
MSNFIKICCDKRGTHTIQKMFEIVNKPEEKALIEEAMKGKIEKLSLDTHGHHVVSKVLQTFKD